jgi:ADP-ribose pyrophosphatase
MSIAWERVSEEPYGSSFRHLLRRTYKLPDGRLEIFDVKDEAESVCILPITPEGRVVVVRQFRPGPGRIVTDLPGGAIDHEESAVDAAARELLEETGYEGMLREIGTCLECGYSTKIRHNFVCRDCCRIAKPTPDNNEFLEIEEISVDEFRRLLRSGQMTVIETGYLGLDHLGMI